MSSINNVYSLKITSHKEKMFSQYTNCLHFLVVSKSYNYIKDCISKLDNCLIKLLFGLNSKFLDA